VTLTLITTLVVAGLVGHWRFDRARVRTLLAATIGLGSAVIFLGRRAVMTLVPALDYLYVVAALALALAFVVAIWVTRGDRTASRSAI
jgi:cytochrome c oxidase assembly protein subunit 15